MTPAFELKAGVDVGGLRPEMVPVLLAAFAIYQAEGKRLVVTSALDGKHSKGSRHYVGLALDLRSREFSAVQKTRVVNQLKAALGEQYDVVKEKSHFHVEFDPR